MQTGARAPVALQAFCDLVSGSANAHVLHRGQHLTIALPSDNGAQNLLPRLTDHVRDDVGQLDVHLRERLLHALHLPALASQKHPALAPQRAQHTNFFARTKRATKQSVGHELLQPLAVQHIGFAARDIFDVARIDQKYFETARFQKLEQRDPVHARGFHRDRVDAASVEPVGQGVEVNRKTWKLPDRLVVPVRRHRYVMGRTADIDSSRIGMGDR